MSDMSPNIHTLADLFTYLAQNPTELEIFKTSPVKYLRERAIKLPPGDLAIFFAGANKHFQFVNSARQEAKAVDIDAKAMKVTISARDFDVITADEVFSGETGETAEKENKLALRFLDDIVVFAFAVDYKLDGGEVIIPPQDVDIYPYYQNQAIKGTVQGLVNESGSFDIKLDLA